MSPADRKMTSPGTRARHIDKAQFPVAYDLRGRKRVRSHSLEHLLRLGEGEDRRDVIYDEQNDYSPRRDRQPEYRRENRRDKKQGRREVYEYMRAVSEESARRGRVDVVRAVFAADLLYVGAGTSPGASVGREPVLKLLDRPSYHVSRISDEIEGQLAVLRARWRRR